MEGLALQKFFKLILLSSLFFFGKNTLWGAKLSKSSFKQYPDHFKIILKPYKKIPFQKIDKKVYWYSILNETTSKYHKAAQNINSAFVSLGDFSRKNFVAQLKLNHRYTYILKKGILNIAEILEENHPATKFSKHIILAGFAERSKI